jgi:hypothetical protein
MEIKIMKIDEDIKKCFFIMKQLVKNLDESEFLKQVKRKQKNDYKLISLIKNNKIISVAGIRVYEYFACGKFLIIDDLVTDKKMRNN